MAPSRCPISRASAFRGGTQSSKTGRTVHQLFFGRLVAENGKIKLLREAVNLVEIALGVFPNGLADYKAPSAEPSLRL
jgi:hypothetical protein